MSDVDRQNLGERQTAALHKITLLCERQRAVSSHPGTAGLPVRAPFVGCLLLARVESWERCAPCHAGKRAGLLPQLVSKWRGCWKAAALPASPLLLATCCRGAPLGNFGVKVEAQLLVAVIIRLVVWFQRSFQHAVKSTATESWYVRVFNSPECSFVCCKRSKAHSQLANRQRDGLFVPWSFCIAML